jgi:hypothetical protein
MGVFAGPKISNENNIIFSIDGKNAKSFPENGKIRSLITQEEKNTTAIQRDGYIYSNNGSIDKFTNFSISDTSAITVNISVDNTELKSGTAFSIYSDDVGGSYAYSGITSYSSGIVTTSSLGIDTHSVNYSPTGITSYSSGIVTTSSLGIDTHSVNYSPTGITSYSSGIVTTSSLGIDTHSVNYSSTGITSYSSGIVTTQSTGIFISDFNSSVELSCSLFPTNIFITNKNLNNQTYLSQPLENQGKDIYSIVFRTLNTNSSPITIYRNGSLLSSSEIKTGTTQFGNVGISLFGLGNSYYSQYGIRLINIYNKELNDQEVQLINNLKTN